MSIGLHPVRCISREPVRHEQLQAALSTIAEKETSQCDSWSSAKHPQRQKKKAPSPIHSSWLEMGKYNEELMKAGVLLALDGLHPSSEGARVKFSGKSRTVIDGPFTEAKELIAAFSILQVKSLEEAIEWVKRGPNCSPERLRGRNPPGL